MNRTRIRALTPIALLVLSSTAWTQPVERLRPIPRETDLPQIELPEGIRTQLLRNGQQLTEPSELRALGIRRLRLEPESSTVRVLSENGLRLQDPETLSLLFQLNPSVGSLAQLQRRRELVIPNVVSQVGPFRITGPGTQWTISQDTPQKKLFDTRRNDFRALRNRLDDSVTFAASFSDGLKDRVRALDDTLVELPMTRLSPRSLRELAVQTERLRIELEREGDERLSDPQLMKLTQAVETGARAQRSAVEANTSSEAIAHVTTLGFEAGSPAGESTERVEVANHEIYRLPDALFLIATWTDPDPRPDWIEFPEDEPDLLPIRFPNPSSPTEDPVSVATHYFWIGRREGQKYQLISQPESFQVRSGRTEDNRFPITLLTR
ncbi:MAG: hypothetical protein RL885_26880 [Planctomycetota bacterium]